jgi:hypothetical protein
MNTRAIVAGAALLAWLSHGTALAQQWPGSALALRTNGGALRSGDCVRLSLVATDDVAGPLQPTVSYAFNQSVTIEDEDGNKRTETRRTTVERPVSPALERLTAGASVLLDDSFCFGQSSLPGPYDITVRLAASGVSVAQLTTCVGHYADDEQSGPACGFALRGVLRRDSNDTVVLDVPGGATVLQRLLVFRGESLLRVIEHGIAASGPSEVSVPGSAFEGLGSAPIDVVLNDQVSHRSASAARMVLQR